MRPQFFLILFLCLKCYSDSLSSTFTLEELVDSAYKHSGLVKNSTIALDQSYNKTKEVLSSLFPTVTLNGNTGRYFRSYDHYSTESSISFTDSYKSADNFGLGIGSSGDLYLANLLDKSVQSRSFAPKDRFMGFGISIHQPILMQGKGYSDVKISKVESSLLVCHWQDVRMHVKSDIAKLYYGYLKTKSLKIIENKLITLSEDRHKATCSSFKNGTILALDTLVTFLEVAQARDILYETELKHNDADQALRKATGISEEVNILDELSPLPYDINFEKALEKLIETNKKITTIRGEENLAKLQVDRSKKMFTPRLSVGAELSRVTDFNTYKHFDLEPERLVHIDFSYDITTSGKRWFNLLQAKQNEQIVQNKLSDMIRDKTIELKKSWSDWETIKQRIARTKQTIEAAENAVKISEIQFASGAITSEKKNEISRKMLEIQKSYTELLFKHNCIVIDIRLLTADYIYN